MIRSLCLAACLIWLAAGVVGCGQTAPPVQPTTQSEPPAEDHGDHEHHHMHGPHDGTIADWGGGAYHVEFTVDHDAKEATVYVLGEDAKSPVPIGAKQLLLSINEPSFQVELLPQPLEGEAKGTSSRFVGQHENLGIVREFAGTISAEVEGTPYAGDFQEEPHGADHKH